MILIAVPATIFNFAADLLDAISDLGLSSAV